ncbi:uncharacterized protein PHALS_08327 [Plasmopara halstedii]|uniref:Uncharacterized protein n=1 Tax=Plasmopara halstedii TaxID=4781 RepID=A0A0P1ABK1_PLAHL|nr:uncharacterized protein PHALS_08327 [Plasmopara halstedii]CEG38241.1 hypothetical protein PHALS_08327 [Plasmopara halstedii]|eukprot:XP_024574610.1 hypothetical protein PHALS_08327 [Plasmopara halstedii]
MPLSVYFHQAVSVALSIGNVSFDLQKAIKKKEMGAKELARHNNSGLNVELPRSVVERLRELSSLSRGDTHDQSWLVAQALYASVPSIESPREFLT